MGENECGFDDGADSFGAAREMRRRARQRADEHGEAALAQGAQPTEQRVVGAVSLGARARPSAGCLIGVCMPIPAPS